MKVWDLGGSFVRCSLDSVDVRCLGRDHEKVEPSRRKGGRETPKIICFPSRTLSVFFRQLCESAEKERAREGERKGYSSDFRRVTNDLGDKIR